MKSRLFLDPPFAIFLLSPRQKRVKFPLSRQAGSQRPLLSVTFGLLDAALSPGLDPSSRGEESLLRTGWVLARVRFLKKEQLQAHRRGSDTLLS